MKKKYFVIINPASGKPYPILHTINKVFDEHKYEWSVHLTNHNNTVQLAKMAAESDADVVVVYGGDGTICQVAGQLIHTEKDLAIIPGGTANVLSNELNIPQDIKEACRFMCSRKAKSRRMDVGQINDKHFLLRVSFGVEAEAIKGTDRASKTQLGILAYALSSLKAVVRSKSTKYQMTIDDQFVECEGMSLIIANSGNLGIYGLKMFPGISIEDGQLDILLIRKADLNVLFSLDDSDQQGDILSGLFKHWKAKNVSISTKPAQHIQHDGELYNAEQIDIRVLPKALRVLS